MQLHLYEYVRLKILLKASKVEHGQNDQIYNREYKGN
jgi:hypothetical protein